MVSARQNALRESATSGKPTETVRNYVTNVMLWLREIPSNIQEGQREQEEPTQGAQILFYHKGYEMEAVEEEGDIMVEDRPHHRRGPT